jgi:hypothetical protein
MTNTTTTPSTKLGRADPIKAVPEDISADHVRAAARHWDKGNGFENFGNAKRYHVWIDARIGAKPKPYPPKANVALAARYADKPPLKVKDFVGAKDGPWHRRLKKLGFDVRPIGVLSAAATAEHDVRELRLRKGLSATTRKQLVDARLGQGRFRRDLEDHWDSACAVTGIQVRDALRASHIVAWADADDDTRLDPHNGLLLVATLDALFDRGHISFANDGALLVHPKVEAAQAQLLGLAGPELRLRSLGQRSLTDKRRAYLEQHREKYGFPVA